MKLISDRYPKEVLEALPRWGILLATRKSLEKVKKKLIHWRKKCFGINYYPFKIFLANGESIYS